MAIGESNIGLLFKITADASQATAELSRFQSLIANNLNSISGLATRVGTSFPNLLKGASVASDEAARKLSGIGDVANTVARSVTQLQPALGGAGGALQSLIGAGSGASGALSGVGAASGAASLAMGAVAVAALAAVGAVAGFVSVAGSVGSFLSLSLFKLSAESVR